jgi:sec-independent protein translocase protein TatA
MPELLVILVIALLVFGTNRLPEVGSSLGKAIRGFKHAVDEPEPPPKTLEPAAASQPCPRCSSAVPRAAAFCPGCGAPVRQG